jgi:DNA-binding transcriptional MerR regulator
VKELGVRDLLSIGRFARLSGLTIRTLRHYDEIGLLRPARIDASSGYRYYSLAQARDAEAIRRLRSLDVPLENIAPLLHADEAALRERLAVHRAQIEGRAVETQRILAELDRLIDGKEALVPEAARMEFKLEVKDVPDRRVLLARERADADGLKEVIPRLIVETNARLLEGGGSFAGPPLCVCPFPDEDGMAEVSVGWPLPPGLDLPGAEMLSVGRALVLEHKGPYEELGRSYRLMSEVMEKQGLTPAGDPVEVYWSDPEEVTDPDDYVTTIEWPIGEGGEWPPAIDYFTRRVG